MMEIMTAAARASFDASSAVLIRRSAPDGLPPAVVQWIGPGHLFRLLEPYGIHLRIREFPYLVAIAIAEGFEFDAGSVPRVAWAFISPLDLGVIAVLVHDYLYRTGGAGGQLSRSEADRTFLQHMKAEGVSWWRRRSAWLAVRIGGRSSWKQES